MSFLTNPTNLHLERSVKYMCICIYACVCVCVCVRACVCVCVLSMYILSYCFPSTRRTVDERLHEQGGLHVPDKRLSRSELVKQYPTFNFEDLQSEEDPFWFNGDVRETVIHMLERGHAFLTDLNKNMDSLIEKEKNQSPVEEPTSSNPTSSPPILHVCIFTHSSFLLSLFNAVMYVEDNPQQMWFHTGEVRSVARV